MEVKQAEFAWVKADAETSNEGRVVELTELQLAVVGGGIAEVVGG